MKNNVVFSLLCFIIFLLLSLQGCISEQQTSFSTLDQRVWYVDQNGFGNTTLIQEAIDNAHDNDTIIISSGIYYEQLVIDKQLTILGEDALTTIIDAEYTNDAVFIASDQVMLKNITIRHAGKRGYPSYDAAVHIQANNTNLSNLILSENTNGIYAEYGQHNSFYNNTINQTGEFGLYISFADSNQVVANHFHDNYCSLKIKGSENCTVKLNHFKDSTKGMYFCCGSKNNVVFFNNFVNHSDFNGDDQVGGNNWYDQSIKKGNYWDDYEGSDIDRDGIGEQSYNISEVGGPDLYPLINPIF